MAAGGDVRGGT